MFHSANRAVRFPQLFIDGQDIEYTQNFNFLGINLNQNLKWSSHIEAVAKKLSRTIGVMNRSNNLTPLYALLNIYDALIHDLGKKLQSTF